MTLALHLELNDLKDVYNKYIKDQSANMVTPEHKAMFIDKIRVVSGQHQLYGTQYIVDNDMNAELLPLQNEKDIDKIRKEAGLQPLDEYVESVKRAFKAKATIMEPYKGNSGVEYIFEYSDADSFDELDYNLCRQVYGICFFDDKMVIGYGGQKHDWGLIGGTIEAGETFEQTLKREIQEESNMGVLKCIPVGYQKVIDTRNGSHIFQLRYVCTVRPIGPFTSDPAGGVTEIKLISPNDYKQYFDWGKIGERMIGRALELKEKLK